MTTDMSPLLQAAQISFAAQEQELAATRALQRLSIVGSVATGSADINNTFSLDRAFRLVFVRCHFVGGTGTAPMTISVSSGSGTAYDTLLYTIPAGGTGMDVNFRLPAQENAEPSSWVFQVGDAVRMGWVNPDSPNMTWGLEVGLAIAS